MQEAQPSGKVRVVVASTDPRLRKLLYSVLARDRRLDVVAHVTDGGAVVTCDAGFDAAVVDVAIPGLGILGVMSILGNRLPKPVVIVVSRTDTVYLMHACLAEGASDYLVVPEALSELPARVLEALQSAAPAVVSER